MDQQKIGRFLKDLRKERGVTQEQLAERLGVSNRSVSRWENGVTMPDFDLLIQIAKLYDVEIEEILDGERKVKKVDRETEATMQKIADYNKNNTEKRISIMSKWYRWMFIAGIAAVIACLVIDEMGLRDTSPYDFISGFMQGLALGDLILGVLLTSGFMAKVSGAKMSAFGAFKRKLLKRDK